MIQTCLLVLLAASQLHAMTPVRDWKMNRFHHDEKKFNDEKMEKLEDLMKDLTTSHLPFVYPGTDMTIKTKMHILCVDKDVFNPEMITVRMLEKYTWMDHRMTWEPTEYNGIKEIHLPSHMIWTPHMVLYSSDHEVIKRSDVNVVITYTGHVTWMPLTMYRMRCGTKMTTHMTHMTDTDTTTTTDTCHLTIGPDTMTEDDLKMTMDGNGVGTTTYGTHCPMTVTTPTGKVESTTYSEGTYSTFTMTFNVNTKM